MALRDGHYAPHLVVGPAGSYLGVCFIAGPEALGRGERGLAVAELLYVDRGVDYAPLVPGAEFEVREGPATVGRGRVVRRWREGPGESPTGNLTRR